MIETINTIRKIYNSLGDDRSRYIFEKRMLYNFTEDEKYLLDIIQSLPQKGELDDMVDRIVNQADKLVLWGGWTQFRRPDIFLSAVEVLYSM